MHFIKLRFSSFFHIQSKSQGQQFDLESHVNGFISHVDGFMTFINTWKEQLTAGLMIMNRSRGENVVFYFWYVQ